MLDERACRNCSAPVIFTRGRAWDVAGRGGPHWCAPIEAPLDDLIECVCGSVVWRAADGTKTDTTTGEPHAHNRAVAITADEAVVVQEQARGGATPPPRPVAPPNGRAVRAVMEIDG